MTPSERITQIYNQKINSGQKISMSDAILVYLDAREKRNLLHSLQQEKVEKIEQLDYWRKTHDLNDDSPLVKLSDVLKIISSNKE